MIWLCYSTILFFLFYHVNSPQPGLPNSYFLMELTHEELKLREMRCEKFPLRNQERLDVHAGYRTQSDGKTVVEAWDDQGREVDVDMGNPDIVLDHGSDEPPLIEDDQENKAEELGHQLNHHQVQA